MVYKTIFCIKPFSLADMVFTMKDNRCEIYINGEELQNWYSLQVLYSSPRKTSVSVKCEKMVAGV